jgi:hypothetical protein
MESIGACSAAITEHVSFMAKNSGLISLISSFKYLSHRKTCKIQKNVTKLMAVGKKSYTFSKYFMFSVYYIAVHCFLFVFFYWPLYCLLFFLLATVLFVVFSIGHCIVCCFFYWSLCCLLFFLLATVLFIGFFLVDYDFWLLL